jgi:hypothetical protein
MDTITAEQMRDDCDWQQAWGYGNGTAYLAHDSNDPAYGQRPIRPPGALCSEEPCGVEDVAEVIAASEGENDERDWVAVARLKDGRFAYVEAGCDYTGWDCQAGGHVSVSHDLAHLWQFGLTQDARDRLGDEPPKGSA